MPNTTLQIRLLNSPYSETTIQDLIEFLAKRPRLLPELDSDEGETEAETTGLYKDVSGELIPLIISVRIDDGKREIKQQLLNRSIQSLDLTERLKRSLMQSWQHDSQNVFVRTPQYDLETIGQLCEATVSQLLLYQGLGDAKIALIRRELTRLGLCLAE